MSSGTPFKTPLSHISRKHNGMYTPRTATERSDSEESTTSEGSSAYTGSSTDLSVVALYDDLMRLMKFRRDKKTEEAFLSCAEQFKMMLDKYGEVITECDRLRMCVDLKTQECSETERRMNTARHYLDEEKKKTLRVIREKEELEEQLDKVRELLFKDNRVKIGDDAKEKLSFLNKRYTADTNGCNMKNLSAIHEINSTGSMLSDFSVSRSEDDLDTSRIKETRGWKKHKASVGGDVDPPTKKRRSSNKVIEIGPCDTVRATTTISVTKKGPITATSVIESLPNTYNNNCIGTETPLSSDDGIGSTAPNAPPAHLVFESWKQNESSPRRNNNKPEDRQHNWQQKTIVLRDSCVYCEKRIGFGKTALKCKECRSICHYECKDYLPLPCVPVVNTPNHKNILGVISDYTPTTPPMVPALIIHCCNEIEFRGLNELGIYRISASEKEVKQLKEKFLKGRGSPSISQTDIHVICGCVKDFLRSLTEPLVTFALWRDFAHAVEAKDRQDVIPAIYQCISDLPQPNRDTLAYMILHLQRISEAPECKMPMENLAKVFGPTIVGFSCDNPSPDCLLTETRQQIAVVDQLIRLPSDYWLTFININTIHPTSRLQQTPSTDSLLHPNRRFFTPNGASARSQKKRKYFDTPPGLKRK